MKNLAALRFSKRPMSGERMASIVVIGTFSTLLFSTTKLPSTALNSKYFVTSVLIRICTEPSVSRSRHEARLVVLNPGQESHVCKRAFGLADSRLVMSDSCPFHDGWLFRAMEKTGKRGRNSIQLKKWCEFSIFPHDEVFCPLILQERLDCAQF